MKYKKIMLIITESCNLRCVYCYEQEKRPSTMNFNTAKKILDYSFSQMDGYDGMTIELHGGEPFLNFSLIKKIDAYVMERYSIWPVLFRTTTNGTLVHGEIQDWLKERRERYQVMLSLDGKQPEHDANRRDLNGRGSFSSIDLDFFLETWKFCPVSMTVNERTLPWLASGTIWMQEKGFKSLNAFQWAVSWDLKKNRPILAKQLELLVDYYSQQPNKHMSLLVNYQLSHFFLPIDGNYRYCVDIDDPLECYDAEGRYAPCHGFTAFTTGSEETARDFSDKTIHDFVFEERNICCECRLVRLCRICFAANHMMTGDMQKQSEEICVFNRMCIEASIRIQRNRIQAKAEPNQTDLKDLRAADAVEQYLKEKWQDESLEF